VVFILLEVERLKLKDSFNAVQKNPVAAIVRWRRNLPPYGGSYTYSQCGTRHASLDNRRDFFNSVFRVYVFNNQVA